MAVKLPMPGFQGQFGDPDPSVWALRGPEEAVLAWGIHSLPWVTFDSLWFGVGAAGCFQLP